METTQPTWTAQYARPTKRTWILNCKRCKAHRRVEAGEVVPMVNNAPHVICCTPDRQMDAKPLKGFFCAEVVCSAICTGAKGHQCDCSCAGKNHGSAA
jgi:hypothetical protein